MPKINCKILLFFYFYLSFFQLFAQNIGNEWINFTQPYYKISVIQTGIHKITYEYLAARGFPVSAANPQYYQIWRRGSEISIQIQGEADGVFNSGDNISFFAQSNDGMQESNIYHDSTEQTHPYLSLYSDTSAYFLTVSPNRKGKRMVTSSGIDNVNIQPYHLEETVVVQKNRYNEARLNPDDPKPSWGVSGEGWVGNAFGQNQSDEIIMPISNVYPFGDVPLVQLRVAGAYPSDHLLKLEVINSTNNATETFSDLTFSNYTANTFTRSLFNFNTIKNTNTVKLKLTELRDSYACLAYIKIIYPQLFDMQGVESKYFNISASNFQAGINVANPPNNSLVYDITDFQNPIIINSIVQNNVLKFNTPAIGNRKLYISSVGKLSTVADLKPFLFSYINSSISDYLIVTHQNLLPEVIKYANYRSSIEGGNYKTMIATTEDLYNQFSYGETNPLAIRNFCRYMYKHSTSKNIFLFLVGQGVQVNQENGGYSRFNAQSANYLKNYIPPFGFPPSDLLYSVGVNKTSNNAIFPTGRLAAKSGADVINYLNKVIEQEKLPQYLDWRKNSLLISGGRTIEEFSNFKNYINGFKNILEGKFLGGNSKTYGKSTPESTEIFNVSSEINAGIALLITFGHTSPTQFDVDIGAASNPIFNYSNKGRYPFLYINGCQSGNSFVANTTSENWLITPDKGAILALGHTDVGEAYTLSQYGNIFLSTAYSDTSFLDKSVGEIQLAANNKFVDKSTFGAYGLAQMQQFMLQGDPAIKLYNPKIPDYYVTDSYLSLQSIDKSTLNAQTDNFGLKFKVMNFGKYSEDSLRVLVTRTLNDGKKIVYKPQIFAPVARDQTYIFKLKSEENGGGLNMFELKINYNNKIEESNYNNNVAKIEFSMPSNGIVCLFPTEFSIVSAQDVNFTAQSLNLLANNKNYVLEIDTSYLFNSKIKIISTIKNSESLVELRENIFKNLPIKDSTVFFWRVRYKEYLPKEDTLWGNSSFMYIKDSPPGWSQAIFPQFFKNELTNIVQDTIKRDWKFKETKFKIEAFTSGINVVNACENTYLKYNDNYAIRPGGMCRDRGNCNGTFGLAISNSELKPYVFDLDGQKEYFECKPLANKFMGPVSGNFEAYLNAIPAGDYVILLSSANQPISSWSPTLKMAMNNFGTKKIELLKDGWPYLFIGQKGKKGLLELLPDTTSGTSPFEQNLYGVYTIKSTLKNGKITSTRVGPASEWGTMYKKFTKKELLDGDKSDITIYGQDLLGNNTKIFQGNFNESLQLNAIADPLKFPYLYFETNVSDSLNFTPPQLKKWQVLYGGVAEGTIYFNSDYIDTALYNINKKQEGDSIFLKFAFKNISEKSYSADSLIVQYSMFNSIKNKKIILTDKIKAPKPNTVSTFSQKFATENMEGSNYIQIYVNPKITPEITYNNNIFDLPVFQVISDSSNPILDVTFDGKKIANGQKVSPNVQIDVRLHDENKYLYNDTSGFKMMLRKICDNQKNDSCSYKLIPLKSSEVSYILGSRFNNNQFSVAYKPTTLVDGKYSFWVNGTDAKKNISGFKPYQIDFEVVSDCKIVELYAYPNPMENSCNFYLDLICNDSIINNKIKIIDVNGKIVQLLKNEDLVKNKDSNRLIDFYWDGSSSLKNKITSGLYIYEYTGEKKIDGKILRKLGKILIL